MRRRGVNAGVSDAIVAEVWMEAVDGGYPPTQAVAETFGVSYSTATKWVDGARKTGELPPTTPGAAPHWRHRRCPTCGAMPSKQDRGAVFLRDAVPTVVQRRLSEVMAIEVGA